MRAVSAIAAGLLLVGCATGEGGGGGGGDVDGAPRPDADHSVPPDAFQPGAPDAAIPPDATQVPPDGMPTGGVVDTCAQGQNITTGALTVAGATVTGDTTGYANDLEPASSCTGYIPDGPDAVYYVNATAGQTLSATVTATWDSSIFITQTCTFNAVCLIGADAGGGVESVTWNVATTGQYFVIVESWDAGAYGPYSLNVKLQ